MRKILGLLLLLYAVPASALDLVDRAQIPQRKGYDPQRGPVYASRLLPMGRLPLFQVEVRSGGGGGITSGTTPISGGADTQVCFNDAATLSCGDAGFLYNKTTDIASTVGGFRTGDGTTAAPTYSFTNGTGYGMYFIAGSNAVAVAANGTTFVVLANTTSGGPTMSVGSSLSWTDNASAAAGTRNIFLSPSAAATLQLGDFNAAVPVAQTLRSQGSRGGTDSNVAGQSFTLYSGLGTGTAVPSNLILRSGVAQVSGTTQHTLTDSVVVMDAGAQITRAELALNADYTNATTTPSNTALSVPGNVIAGRTYSFSLGLMFDDSTAADGAMIDFDGGTATATNFRVGCSCSNATGAALVFTTANATAIATDIDVTLALTTQANMTCIGTFVPATTGTFIVRGMQKAHSTGTLTIRRGSWLNIRVANPL